MWAILHDRMKLHDARLDDFLNIDNGLSTEDTRTPAAIASDIKDAEDKESEQSSSSDDDDLQNTPPTREKTIACAGECCWK